LTSRFSNTQGRKIVIVGEGSSSNSGALESFVHEKDKLPAALDLSNDSNSFNGIS